MAQIPRSAGGPVSLTAESITLAGLDGDVAIFRDKFGIPHVRAESAGDAFFAQGFVHAQDRLFAMDFDRKRAAGRASEYLGSTALLDDVLYLRLAITHSTQLDYSLASPETRAMLTSYAAGVNAFIRLGDLPCEYGLLGLTASDIEPWEPHDPIAIWKVRHVLMGNAPVKLTRARLVASLGIDLATHLVASVAFNGTTELIIPEARDAGEEYAFGLSAIEGLKGAWDVGLRQVVETGVAGGSNCWVVGGGKTEDGAPMLGGDPHRDLDSPTVYYPNHIRCSEFDAIGFSFHGIPGIQHFGHTERVGWCITHAMTDYQDLYLEKVVPGPVPGPHYLSASGAPTAFSSRVETIKVLSVPPTSPPTYTSQQISSYATLNGPVVLGDPTRDAFVVTLRYTALEPNRHFDCYVKSLKAKTADEFEDAMREWVDSCNNLCYLDADGNFGYRTRGKIPIRHPLNGWLPVPGWLTEYQWLDTIPFEEMPSSRNPTSGRVVTCNNPIQSTNGDYKHYLSNDYYPPSRALRVHQIMDEVEQQARKFVPADFSAIHNDKLSVRAPVFQKLLASLSETDTASLSADARQIRAAVLGWDCVTDKDSADAAAYEMFRESLYLSVLNDPQGPLSKVKEILQGEGDPKNLSKPLYGYFYRVLDMWIEKNDLLALPKGKPWAAVAAAALETAATKGKTIFGADIAKWRWGTAHNALPTHPLSKIFPDLASTLNQKPFEMGGDMDTTQQSAGFNKITFLSCARYIMTPAESWGKSTWIIPGGNSGHPLSPHYNDQAELYAKNDVVKMIYEWSEIEREAESKSVLKAKQ
ncbi:N-terminal nucleophile aminohydrolase [Gonapodya prolifera JEL478]|uniref:N-terminal nucleophile aminohydrolase n=1 Tax=Gonapodya prolifera (strain JEL478) TaxID=1344416 RepID=A0A139A4N4_GONPJ|nr:N-terminal nucleophile aminohydrolase [Gonapodya prolifera JEL478]|eukprot:KXS11609.1 N-terminal nucleophile aminohydrolase [Gonapodya prolifera JEL478]